jgi:Uma2 family endonuclease
MQTDFPILGVPVEDVPMGAPKLKHRYTVDEYLKTERAAVERHIYLDGEIFAMANESGAHADISVNIVASVATQLKGSPCRARTKDTKVRSGPIPETGHSTKGMFSYSDIVVVCGEVEYHDAYKDVILNPKAIFEVLSESTEAFDRGEKFHRFQRHNPTLTDYVLVSQDKAQVEHYYRQPDGEWMYRLHSGLDASVVIGSIGCTLRLTDVYDRVVFPEK